LEQGFFIPNDRKKYSIGENAGMKLNEEGGIEIYIAAEQPARSGIIIIHCAAGGGADSAKLRVPR
jgi:hypothetical protein